MTDFQLGMATAIGVYCVTYAVAYPVLSWWHNRAGTGGRGRTHVRGEGSIPSPATKPQLWVVRR